MQNKNTFHKLIKKMSLYFFDLINEKGTYYSRIGDYIFYIDYTIENGVAEFDSPTLVKYNEQDNICPWPVEIFDERVQPYIPDDYIDETY